jgi:bifunctional ADP-heptose synthase (sugar kinase/adenylyltransferase)
VKKIAIIGESCIDEYAYGECERVCPEAAALCFSHNNDMIKVSHGMASNVYRNAISLNKNAGFDISLICSNSKIIKRRFVDKRYNTIVFREDINDVVERIDLSKHKFQDYDCIIFSDYCKGFLLESDIIQICESKNKECKVFIDTKKQILNIASHVDFIKINSIEFKRNADDLSRISNRCNLIVTTGEEGATLYNRDGKTNFAAEKIQLRDVCGAGDTFLAALSLKYLETNNINDAIIFANQCAAIVVSKFGVETI